MRPRQWEVGDVVIKGGGSPRLSRMTFRAFRRESSRGVIGVWCVRVVVAMAGDTSRLGSCVTTRMTVTARDCKVRTGQRESCKIMIEISGAPPRCRVALVTLIWEARCNVIGVSCRSEIRFMTRDASGRSSRESR